MKKPRINIGKTRFAQPCAPLLVQIDQYSDKKGSVVTVVPGRLWLVIDGPEPCHLTQPIDVICPRCGNRLQTFALTNGAGEASSCGCLLVIFAPPLTLNKVARAWASLLQIQTRVLARITPPERN